MLPVRYIGFYYRLSMPVLLLFAITQAYAQNKPYAPTIHRILFVVDGSGSMKQEWNGKTKFETAKNLLFKIIDSVERKNPNVEFAVRVFGYQYGREQKICTDSKLLVPFAKNNAQKIIAALNKVKPQGMSPVAYSLQAGAKDFGTGTGSLNSMVLITDGEENCGGDPCKASQELLARKIALKPFIVGLNLDSLNYGKLKCIGTVYDTKDEAAFYKTVGVIIKQTLNSTTAQVNLLDGRGLPAVTNIPFTLYNHFTGTVEYNFIHTLDAKGNPDTLFLDPTGVYDLEVHTTPSIKKENIELTPGRHNIIAVDVPVADLSLECPGVAVDRSAVSVIRNTRGDIVAAQNINTRAKYLSGNYRVEMLTTPPLLFDTLLKPMWDTKIKIGGTGAVMLTVAGPTEVSVYRENKLRWQMVDRLEITGSTASRKYQAGEYKLVYQPKNSYSTETTKTLKITVDENRVLSVGL